MVRGRTKLGKSDRDILNDLPGKPGQEKLYAINLYAIHRFFMNHPSVRSRLRTQLHKIFENELIRRIIKNSGYLFSTNGISAALSMLQGILVARLLGAAGFGILGTITLFTSTINNLASFRMSELVVKYVGHFTENNDEQRAAAIFKAAAITEMVASLFAFILIMLLAPTGARYFAKDPSTTSIFMMYGLVVLANLMAESSTGLLQISDRFRRIAVLNLVQSIVVLTLIALIYKKGGNLSEVVIAYLIGKAVGALGITISAFTEASRRWGSYWWRSPIGSLQQQWRGLTHFAISTNISATISLATKDSEILWVSYLSGPLQAGYYKLALALANIIQMPVDPLPQATYPELSRQVARRNWNNLRYILRQGSGLAGGYSLFMTLVLIVLGQPLIRFLYNPEFLPSYPALIILLIGLLVANTYYWRRIALLALGRADFPAKVNLILAILKIGGIFLLVPRYGYLASAALLSGFYVTGSLISVWKIRSLMEKEEVRT
jgi:O-antigen/teichoic acid export membrane protein